MTIETHTHTVVREVEVRTVPQGGKKVSAYLIRDKAINFDPRNRQFGDVTYTTSRAVALSYVRADAALGHDSPNRRRYQVVLCEVWKLKDGSLVSVLPIQSLPLAEKLK